jgi:flagellar basal-body rod protein FlgB
MFLDRLMNQGSAPLLEQWLQFTESRQRLLAEDVANISTPHFAQKDLSLAQFQSLLRDRVNERDSSPPDTVSFDDISMDVQHPRQAMLFHDGSTRSMEQLMTDQAKNALMHQMAVELLRDQYSVMEMALKERVG